MNAQLTHIPTSAAAIPGRAGIVQTAQVLVLSPPKRLKRHKRQA